MIELNIVSVGTLKEKYWSDAISEYAKRLSAYASVHLYEVKEFNSGDSEASLQNNKKAEAALLEKYKKGYTFSLEINGKNYDSVGFAKKLQTLSVSGHSAFTFFIGGSNGLDAEFSKSCNEQLSFSSFTFPHQLMRVILMEQLYRAFTILHNKTYHK